MIKTYSLIIRFDSRIEFEALLSDDVKYFRVLKDLQSYEKIINQLLQDGYIKSTRVNDEVISLDDGTSYNKPIFNETHILINSPQELLELLTEQGMECELQDKLNNVMEIIADGQDIGFDGNIIAPSDRSALMNFSTSIYKAVNDSDYDPALLEDTGSYKLIVQDAVVNNKTVNYLKSILKNIENEIFDANEYTNNHKYRQIINEINEIFNVKNLSILKFNILQETITIKKSILSFLHTSIASAYASQSFNQIITNPKAFNDENDFTFKIYLPEMRIVKTTYEIYRKAEKNKSKSLRLTGRYESSKTIRIDKITIV